MAAFLLQQPELLSGSFAMKAVHTFYLQAEHLVLQAFLTICAKYGRSLGQFYSTKVRRCQQFLITVHNDTHVLAYVLCRCCSSTSKGT